MKSTHFIFSLIICCALSFQGCSQGDIVILYDNDVHCRIDGYANISAMKRSALRFTDNVLVVSSGDFSQGGAIGSFTKGESVISIMNAVGYDVVTLGNHEFDYGFDRLRSNMTSLNADVTDCNLIETGTGKPLFAPFVIKDVDGRKIAFIGVTTPLAVTSSTPAFFMDENGNFKYGFCKDSIMTVIQNTVDKARKSGADYVIALSHIGVDEDIPGLSSYRIAAATSGIDVILDGHSHTEIPCERLKNKDGREVVLTQTGCYFKNIGRLTISPTGEISTELIPLAEYNVKDSTVVSVIDSVSAEYNRFAGRLIALTEFPLPVDYKPDERTSRMRETPMGDLCADAYRQVYGTDVGVLNAGTIRAGLVNSEILFNDVYTAIPFGNSAVVLEMTGSTIADMLEYSVFLSPGPFGGFLQVSGLCFDADLTAASPVKLNETGMYDGIEGTRRVKNIRILNRENGKYEPLVPGRKYTVAGGEYILLNKGNGYAMFDSCEQPQHHPAYLTDYETLEVYLSKYLNGKVPECYHKAQERIRFLGEKR